MTRAGDSPCYTRILAALDPDPDNRKAPDLDQSILGLATSLAVLNDAELHLAHAWDVDHRERVALHSGLRSDARRRLLGNAKARARKRLVSLVNRHALEGLDYRIHLPRGEPGIAISKLVEKWRFDLIALGTVCRTGIPGFFIGNTAEFLLHAVDCAILAVKPKAFVTPVTQGARKAETVGW